MLVKGYSSQPIAAAIFTILARDFTQDLLTLWHPKLELIRELDCIHEQLLARQFSRLGFWLLHFNDRNRNTQKNWGSDEQKKTIRPCSMRSQSALVRITRKLCQPLVAVRLSSIFIKARESGPPAGNVEVPPRVSLAEI